MGSEPGGWEAVSVTKECEESQGVSRQDQGRPFTYPTIEHKFKKHSREWTTGHENAKVLTQKAVEESSGFAFRIKHELSSEDKMGLERVNRAHMGTCMPFHHIGRWAHAVRVTC